MQNFNITNALLAVLSGTLQSTLVISTSHISNNRLSRIENLVSVLILKSYQQITKYCGKEEKFSPLFRNILNICVISGVKLRIHLWNVVVRLIFFLNYTNLICRGTDISKCIR